jgi:Ca2+-binding RTX toxin-like protein
MDMSFFQKLRQILDFLYSPYGKQKKQEIYADQNQQQITTQDGHDMILANAYDQIIHAGGGQDYIKMFFKGSTAYAEAGDDLVKITRPQQMVFGGGGDDVLVSRMVPMAGDDKQSPMIMHGGPGRDSFKITPYVRGKTIIADYDFTQDLIYISGGYNHHKIDLKSVQFDLSNEHNHRAILHFSKHREIVIKSGSRVLRSVQILLKDTNFDQPRLQIIRYEGIDRINSDISSAYSAFEYRHHVDIDQVACRQIENLIKANKTNKHSQGITIQSLYKNITIKPNDNSGANRFQIDAILLREPLKNLSIGKKFIQASENMKMRLFYNHQKDQIAAKRKLTAGSKVEILFNNGYKTGAIAID